MRRLLQILSVAAALVAMAQPVEAQFKFGLQGAVVTGLDEVAAGPNLNGTFGVGPRVAFQPPLLPIGVVGQGVYYFPEGEGSYMTYSLAAQLRLPLPVVQPYAIGGWQWRRAGNGTTVTQNGAMVGVGVQVNLAVAVFLEASMEFNEAPTTNVDADNSIVIKGGVMLGN
ncbi:MAG TPA: outer membrane beta-barrel protein [Longimicrobiales bacterium]|nr:outer membrane beta-barrel protein [Longimicrobiales bacterium]